LREPVARLLRVDHQDLAAGAGKLHGSRETGEIAADDDRFVVHDLAPCR